jgi:hypothetical protein
MGFSAPPRYNVPFKTKSPDSKAIRACVVLGMGVEPTLTLL